MQENVLFSLSLLGGEVKAYRVISLICTRRGSYFVSPGRLMADQGLRKSSGRNRVSRCWAMALRAMLKRSEQPTIENPILS